jgi:hypothetical protein
LIPVWEVVLQTACPSEERGSCCSLP